MNQHHTHLHLAVELRELDLLAQQLLQIPVARLPLLRDDGAAHLAE